MKVLDKYSATRGRAVNLARLLRGCGLVTARWGKCGEDGLCPGCFALTREAASWILQDRGTHPWRQAREP